MQLTKINLKMERMTKDLQKAGIMESLILDREKNRDPITVFGSFQ